MTQHPLFPDPPAVTATVTVNVTQEHLDRAAAEGLHPVALAVIGAVPGTEEVDVTYGGAYVAGGNDVTWLRFDRDGTAFVSACNGDRSELSPVTFQAEVIRP